MSELNRPKPFPLYLTDADAERFVAEADLSDYDFSGFEAARVAFDSDPTTLSLRVAETTSRRSR